MCNGVCCGSNQFCNASQQCQDITPNTYIFGGSFQVEDPSAGCGGDSVVNPVTGNNQCPSGYPPAEQTGRVTTPESKCGANQFECSSFGINTVMFGGMFQVEDSVQTNCSSFLWFFDCPFHTSDSVTNGATGTLGCPRGFTASQIGRVLTPENSWGANQYACTATQSDNPLEDRWRFGGSYQIDDCGQQLIRNPLTQDFTCSSGFTAVQYGRSKNPEGSHCGVEQYVCLLTLQLSPPHQFSFGGMFQVDDCGTDSEPNPTVNPGMYGFACISSLWDNAAQFGRVLAPESHCGATQYLCSSTFVLSGAPLFGGIYQQVDPTVADPNTDTVPNPITGTPQCPNEYQPSPPTPIGRILTPETNFGATQYLCWAPAGTNPVHVYHFGGTYQVDDCGQATLANPITSTVGCPSGYTAGRYGRVKNPELSQCGVNQYLCYY